MACDFKPSIERMKEKLELIRKIANDSLCKEVWIDKYGQKYMCLSKAIFKISVQVRDTMTVREYWYANFVEEGVLVQPKNRGRDVPVASDKDVSSADDATRTSRPLGKDVR